MTEYVAADALAGLPGMPSSPRSVRRKAAREKWLFKDGPSNGGLKRFYNVASLPKETRDEIHARHLQQVVSASEAATYGKSEGAKLKLRETLSATAKQNRRVDGLKASTSLPPISQQRMDAKLSILRALDIYQQQNNLTQQKAELLFADDYNSGAPLVDSSEEPLISADVRRLQPKLSARSLQRWRLLVKEQGISALGGSWGQHRKGSGKIDSQPEVKELIIGLIAQTPHVRATHIQKALEARLGHTDIELPSIRSIERWVDRFRKTHAQTLSALQNPDQWKNKYMVSFGSMSEGIDRLNQVWELDSTPADVMLTDGRHSIIGIIDVYSRRFRMFVSKTSKGSAIATLVRRCLIDWGVCEIAKTDNGKDYVGNHLTRVFRSLDIEQKLCPPFQPWHKPHIERAFGSFTRDLVELLPDFIGHNVAERKAIDAQKSFADRLLKRGEVVPVSLTAEEFQSFCDKWCEDFHMHRSHDGLGGKTPFDVVANWTGEIRRINDERALDILLAEAPDRNGMRTVQKNGIALDNTWFIAPELEEFVGQQVQVRLDEQDLGRIYVFGGPDLQFVCVAECPERTGINRQEVAARGREHQKQRVQEERRRLKAAGKKIKTNELVGEIMRDREVKAGKVAMFPKRRTDYTSSGLQAASDAAAAADKKIDFNDQGISKEEFEQKRAKLEAVRQTPAQPIFETQFQRAFWLMEQRAQRALSGEENEFLDSFKKQNPRGFRDAEAMQIERAGNNKPSA